MGFGSVLSFTLGGSAAVGGLCHAAERLVVPGEALYLHRLAVRRVASGGQVSSALLGPAVGTAAARGARYLRLDCEASQPSLRAVYERFGFTFHSEHSVGPFVVARYQLCLRACGLAGRCS